MPKADNPDTSTAALIIIGNEILSGRTHDTNTPWIAEKLTIHGVALEEIRVVPDIESAIIRAVNALRERYDYVFTTGGIGPTHDDITAASIAKAFDLPLERHEDAYKVLEDYYGIDDLTPTRAKMSLMPRGAGLIPNPVSGAPGFNIGNVYVMAGVPRIMQAMFDHIIREIRPGPPILSSTVTCAMAESTLADDMEELQALFPDVQIGSYPHYRGGSLGLSVVMRTTDDALLRRVTDELIARVRTHGIEPQAVSMKDMG
ncbi:MAG: competence/damage-inducible protein A [Rhodospirillales bacterium]|nr:competence/damage-inducible protein A [Rhodospirillales bacterium]